MKEDSDEEQQYGLERRMKEDSDEEPLLLCFVLCLED